MMNMDWPTADRCGMLPGWRNLTGAAQRANPETRRGENTL